MPKPRLILPLLKRLAERFPIIVLTGARQVGKTTLLHEIFGHDFGYVVFDPFFDVKGAKSDPDLFLSTQATPLILDEVQYAPEVVSALKRFIDRNRKPGQFFLTGSQQWGVLKTMSESLAGRAVFLDLYPFCLSEIASLEHNHPWLPTYLENPSSFLKQNKGYKLPNVQIYEQIWRGFMPEAQEISLNDVPFFYDSYHRTYIERDIRVLANLDSPGQFGQFVKLISALTAQEMNYFQMGREIGISPQTARRWLDLLKVTFQYFEIPAFTGNYIKRVSLKPKGYVVDTGSICSLQSIQQPSALSGNPLWGPLFETAVVAELIKQSTIMNVKPQFYHWRAHSGAEVDLVLDYNGILFPIEIKGKMHPTRGDARGITAFKSHYNHLKIGPGLVISNCDTIYALDENIFSMPWDWALPQNETEAG